MSFFFGGGGKKVKPQYTGLGIQTSASTVAVTILYGTNRIPPNIIWQGDFQAHKQKQKAGKGGGSVTTYTYSGSYILALCYGEINNVTRVWKDQSKETSYAKLGFSLFKGTPGQAPWGYMTTKHPSEALGYPYIAYLAVANYDLGQSNVLAQHSFQVQGNLYNSASWSSGNADVALIIDDFLNNPIYGAWAANTVSPINEETLYSGPDAGTTGDAAFQTYARAMGFALSPPLSDQEEASAIIKRWTDLCNTALVWTGYDLRFIPYESQSITGNGVTYNPADNVTVRYNLTDNDFFYEEGSDPILLKRVDPADAFNSVKLEIRDANNEYNNVPAEWRDQGLIDQYGLRAANSQMAIEITNTEMGAVMAALIGQRVAYNRNSFDFTLTVAHCLIEPMDILRCYDPRWGWFYVRVKTVSEDDEDRIQIEAEEYAGATTNSAPGGVSTPDVVNTPVDTNVDGGPVNPPIIFEPPAALSGAPQIWAAVSGGDGTTANDNWGGCFVWISTDNITYNQIGEIDTPARQGKLTAILPTYGGANPDTTGQLKVNMAMSGAELTSAASATDAANGVTVSYVDGELVSYQTATLTGTDAYTLTQLYRKLYGTTVGAHAIGTNFARLDDAIFKYDLPADYIGDTLYIKFQSYNIFGGAVEDLASCVAYTYVPTGIGFGTGGAGLPAVPTGLSGSAGTTFAKLTWNANSTNDNVVRYDVYRATGSGQPFGSASKIGSTTGTEYTDTAVTGGQAYTYFVVAINSVGSGSPTAGINLTPTAAVISYPYGFAFQRSIAALTVSTAQIFFDSPIAYTLPAGLADCQGTITNDGSTAAVAPTAQTDFDIQSPPGTSIGTMRFAAGSLTATFIKASQSSIPLGQMLQIVTPANLNGMTGTLSGSIKGTR
jgi:hypothetical protein